MTASPESPAAAARASQSAASAAVASSVAAAASATAVSADAAPAPSAIADAAPAPHASFAGVCLAMFLTFAGASSSQFHSYLFEGLGFSGLKVGLLVSAGFAAGILSPLLQVPVIRLFRGPRQPLLIALAGAALALGTLPLVKTFFPLLIHFFAFSFFASAIFPLNTACTLDAVRHRGHGAYFGIRSLGTLGFLAGCAVSVRYTGFSRLPALYLGFAGAYALALAVVAWDYPGRAAREAVAPRSGAGFARAFALLRAGRTGKLLLVLGLMNFANGLALCVQGNYLTHRWAGGQASISQAWVVSTACEVPLFLLCAYVLKRHGLRYVLALGLAGTLVKVLGVAAASELWHYLVALSMHGFFYSGALTGFSVHLDRSFDPADRPALQALSVVFFQGIPNALAGLAAGLVWHVSSLRSVYFLAGIVAVLVSLYGFWLLRHPTAGFRREAAT